jgi:hypothetical protein
VNILRGLRDLRDRWRERREAKGPAAAELQERQRQREMAFVLRTTPKGGNVERAEIRRRRARNKRARASRKRNRPR